jgi:hypothetical protein
MSPPGDVVVISRLKENVEPASIRVTPVNATNPSAFTWKKAKVDGGTYAEEDSGVERAVRIEGRQR